MKQLTPEVLAEALPLIGQLRSGALDDAAITDTVVRLTRARVRRNCTVPSSAAKFENSRARNPTSTDFH
jgi:hypothetical protein